LINRFVDVADIPAVDDVGRRQFQLPLEEQTEENQRAEQKLPIDKYDWIAFDRIYQTVQYPSPREHQLMCFENYSGFHYDVTNLHTDCMELFSYYTNLMMATLVKCTKRSLEAMKTRANVQK
jgi:dynein heavy chain, axonemal